mmetsp:Transcript_21363/g.52252  ORF Transcript_21363/g.52252 Transcript_21363/m.52252 type:complete len:271 (+) Transcript_21363:1475-2287(+)
MAGDDSPVPRPPRSLSNRCRPNSMSSRRLPNRPPSTILSVSRAPPPADEKKVGSTPLLSGCVRVPKEVHWAGGADARRALSGVMVPACDANWPGEGGTLGAPAGTPLESRAGAPVSTELAQEWLAPPVSTSTREVDWYGRASPNGWESALAAARDCIHCCCARLVISLVSCCFSSASRMRSWRISASLDRSLSNEHISNVLSWSACLTFSCRTACLDWASSFSRRMRSSCCFISLISLSSFWSCSFSARTASSTFLREMSSCRTWFSLLW